MVTQENLYPGINPHLNSALQSGEWRSFHSKFITYIADALEDLLLDTVYYVAPESSLQIGAGNLIIPDVMIYRDLPSTQITSSTGVSASPHMTLPLIETIELEEQEDDLSSLVIYNGNRKPVTRVEVLSPSNKPPSSHYPDYISKRTDALQSGLRLVEIDFIHERRPILKKLASYLHQETGALPYYVIVSDPHPNFHEGLTHIYRFGVMDTLPTVDVPLEGKDTVTIDFDMIYRRTFSSAKLFWQILTDYSQVPTSFDRYNTADQERIRQHMALIASQRQ